MQAALIASLAASAVAAPLVSRRQAAAPPAGVNDAVILNYALSLEHLEATFYREALAKFSDEDFKKAGLGADFVNNLKEIAKDEATHVDFLTTGLQQAGAVPAQECVYKFPYTDVQSFLATANLLEGVGVSAYLGAAQFIASPAYLTAAGAILTVESRHSAYIRDNQTPKPLSPFPAPFDIPQSFNNVFSLAAPLIVSCPDGKAGTLGLPFKAYPSIAVGPAGAAKAGDVLTFTVSEKVDAAKAYFITFPGGNIEATIATADGITYQVTVPEMAQPGQAYVVFTSGGEPTDDNTVAGPAVFEILDNAGEFQKANPDYSYGKDCDKDYEHKPVYGKPEAPKDYPMKPEAPKSPEYKPEAPKAPEYKPEAPKDNKPEYKPEAPKDYPQKDDDKKDDYKPAPYEPKKDEPKHDAPAPYEPKKDEPKKDDKPYPAPYPEHKDEPKHDDKPYPAPYPEHKDEPKHDDKPAPYPAKPEHKDEPKPAPYPAKPEEKKPEYKDKEGHPYPLDKDGKVCVYDKEGKPYPNDKDGKPYYHDVKADKYYTIDAYGKYEPCDESYHPY